LYDIYVNLTASRSLLIDDETICITSCIGIQPVGDLICVATQFCIYFINKYRFHKRGRNLLQAFSKCLHEVYFYLKRYSHVNDISTLEIYMRWFEKEFSKMRFVNGWGNSQTWYIGQGNTKYERLMKCFAFGWGNSMREMLMRCFAIGWGNSQI
jgi:hypothetical protein